MIKKLVNGLLGVIGYQLRRKPAIGYTPEYLARICRPRTVIDVGVGHGTYPLYEAYPKAHFILVEPLRDYSASIDRIAGTYDCTVHYKAAGSEEGTLEMNIDPDDLQTSSFVERTSLTETGHELERRTIEVTTLDAIHRQTPTMEGPIVLKLDTEGHELAALQGATNLLSVVDTVIAEVTIAPRFENGYTFEDIVSFMHDHGFQVYSLLTTMAGPGELRQRFADVVFKRCDP